MFDENGNLSHRYLFGNGVDQIEADESNGSVLWALTDHLGSVRDVVDNAGVVQNHIVYDAFGGVTSQSNSSVVFRYGYTARELDAESGLQYNRARYLDSFNGRFISEDPIGFQGQDANLYRYVFNSPINYTDAVGLAGSSTNVRIIRQSPGRQIGGGTSRPANSGGQGNIRPGDSGGGSGFTVNYGSGSSNSKPPEPPNGTSIPATLPTTILPSIEIRMDLKYDPLTGNPYYEKTIVLPSTQGYFPHPPQLLPPPTPLPFQPLPSERGSSAGSAIGQYGQSGNSGFSAGSIFGEYGQPSTGTSAGETVGRYGVKQIPTGEFSLLRSARPYRPDPNSCKEDDEENYPCKSPAMILGGSYREVFDSTSGDRQVHHAPAWGAIKSSGIGLGQLGEPDGYDIAPAFCMKTADHFKTASFAGRPTSRKGVYRDGQSYLISLGAYGFDIAQNLDIVDVRGKFGTKYDFGIMQMETYTQKLKSNRPELFR